MREFLTRNIGLKLLSVLFAISLWLFVNLKATEERVFQFPVQWVNLPSFLDITNPVNDSVRVRVSGPRRILSHLDPRSHAVFLDLTDARAGLMDYQITDKMIALIPGLQAEVLPPDTVQFKFELIVTKEVPVRPSIEGQPPVGYSLERVVVHPDRVRVIGAQSELTGLDVVRTGMLDVSGLRKDSTEKVRIEVGRPHVWPSPGQEQVEVSMIVKEQHIGTWFRNLPVHVENQGEGHVTLEPPEVDVYLKGLAGKIQAVGADDLYAFVRLPSGKDGDGAATVHLRPLFEGIEMEVHPEKVVVTRGAAAP